MRNPLHALNSILARLTGSTGSRLEVAPVAVQRPAMAIACSSRRGITRSPMSHVKARRRTQSRIAHASRAANR